MKPVAEIYVYDDCPEEWRALSDNGGDEDYIVLGGGWLAEDIADKIAVCDMQKVELPDGRTAYITCHA